LGRPKSTLLRQVWFWDESVFFLESSEEKLGVKKKTEKKVIGDRIKGRINVMG
jgi:hypothetical protein